MTVARVFKLTLFFVVLMTCLVIWGAQSGTMAAQADTPDLEVRLSAGTFDPLTESAVSFVPEQLQIDGYGADEQGYYIAQFNGPITAAQKAQLTQQGVRLFDYIPDFSFIARMDGATAKAVAQLPFIRWVGIYQPGYRISPALTTPTLAVEGALLDEPMELAVLVFPDEDTQAIASELEALGGTVLEIAYDEWRDKIMLEAAPDLLPSLPLIEGISWIEAAPEWELHNNLARVDAAMDVNDVWSLGYFGDGQTVAIADTHLDTGNPATYVNDFRDCGDADPRVTIALFPTSAANDFNGHGTHVAGSVLGNGRLDLSTCNNYVTTGAGVAPHPTGYFQAIMDTTGALGAIPTNLNNLFQPAYTFGARIHTNSWGSAIFGQYTTSSQEADQFAWNNKDFLILYSAGNSGRDSDANGVIDVHSLGAPATGKNVLTMGASENNRPGIQVWDQWYSPVVPIFNTDRANNYNGLAAFSSRGPTDDGRTKPSLVAPGTLVRSVRSTLSGGTGNYVLFSGTSMSTPLTAGASVLARQVFSASESHAPSSAMLKSLLANGATDIFPGQYGGGATQEIPTTRPTVHAGWGRVDLQDSLFAASGRTWWWDHNSSTIQSSLNNLSTNGTVTYTFTLNSTASLNITMAWTDFPGTPLAAGGLVNDLDMRLEGPGGPYYANNATQRLSPQLIEYNGGGTFNFVLPLANGHKRAMRFTPTQYPAVPATAKLWFYNASGLQGSINFNLVVYGNNGGGAPGAVLCTLTSRRASWAASTGGFFPVTVDLSPCALAPLASGDFYLSIEFTSAPVPAGSGGLLMDSTASGRAWVDTGSGWTPHPAPARDYGIMAVTYRPIAPATPYDRVNNMVGIDLAAPAVGTYNLVVNGYNVPQGPQPYALTLSSDFEMKGTETVTRTIPGTGTYKFGNTGVSINFTSEDVNTVSVTVRRDQFPTGGMNSVKRAYTITTSGGSGTFNANVIFGYEQSEFAASGISSELSLQAFRYDGSAWVAMGGTPNATNNTVTVNGVTAFSPWAIGEFTPTAVTLHNTSATSTASTLYWLIPATLLALTGVTVWAVWVMNRKQSRQK